MIECYITIRETKRLTISDASINGGFSINKNYLPGLIERLSKYYENNWDIFHNNKENFFIFTLKKEKSKEKILLL